MNTKDKRNLQNQIVDILLDDEVPTPAEPPAKTRVFSANPAENKKPDAIPLSEANRDISMPKAEIQAKPLDLETNSVIPIKKAVEPPSPTPPPSSEPVKPVSKEPKIRGPSLQEIEAHVRKEISPSAGPSLGPADLKLGHSEHIRLAQERILELEQTVDKLSRENEQLLAAGETMKNRADELLARNETIERDLKEKKDIHREEKIVLENTLKARGKEIAALKLKVEELETRLQADLKRVRVRERELENRLEIAKMEGAAVLRSKDEMLLELKRRMDQMATEMENYRAKGKEVNKKLDGTQERMRRTVKALRLALSLLEGDENDAVPIKKAD